MKKVFFAIALLFASISSCGYYSIDDKVESVREDLTDYIADYFDTAQRDKFMSDFIKQLQSSMQENGLNDSFIPKIMSSLENFLKEAAGRRELDVLDSEDLATSVLKIFPNIKKSVEAITPKVTFVPAKIVTKQTPNIFSRLGNAIEYPGKKVQGFIASYPSLEDKLSSITPEIYANLPVSTQQKIITAILAGGTAATVAGLLYRYNNRFKNAVNYGWNGISNQARRVRNWAW